MTSSLYNRRGIGVIEVLIAMVVLTVSFAAFLTALRRSYQYAEQSRNRAIATILARSLLDETRDHVFGTRAPLSWTTALETPATIVVDGKPVNAQFHKDITYLNQSFVNSTVQQDSDVVTVRITWSEEVGDARKDKGTKSNFDNKEIVVSVPVWR